jgi:hypothetical protein
MFRFTIRDVLWLTVVVGVCCAWVLTSRVKDARYDYLLNEYGKILKYAPPEYRSQFPMTEWPATLNRP